MTRYNLPDLEIELPNPWYWCNTDLAIQLQREIHDNHILSNKLVKTIARRKDNDDVLYEIINDEYKYAIVHLTWAQRKLDTKDFPRTRLFKTWNEVFEILLVDHERFIE